jgi:hypothetical protein
MMVATTQVVVMQVGHKLEQAVAELELQVVTVTLIVVVMLMVGAVQDLPQV